MTRFTDGPAAGQALALRRAAFFLRVTLAYSKWDALDQLEDRPAPNEKLFAYEIEGPVNGWTCGRSGCMPIANYKLVVPQPSDEEMRGEEAWPAWVEAEAKRRGLK